MTFKKCNDKWSSQRNLYLKYLKKRIFKVACAVDSGNQFSNNTMQFQQFNRCTF